MEQEAFAQLDAIRKDKKQQLYTYLETITRTADTLAADPAMRKLSYQQPPTRRRPYGNLKLESFVSLLVGGILVAVVIGMVWNSIHSRHEMAVYNLPVLIVVIISIVSK
jgi:divalent metal cation (Fe/Co/Zn/Cd) transporter